MASFARQNKTQVSRIKNTLEKSLRSRVNTNLTSRYDSFGRSHGLISKKDFGKEFAYNVSIFLTRANIVIKESGNRLMFCLNLRDFKFGTDMLSFTENVYYSINFDPRYRDDVDNEIFTEVGEISSWSDRNKIESSTFYQKTYNHVNKAMSQMRLELRSGEYPFMNDRTLMPLIVVDTSNGSGWYIHGDKVYDMTYRSNHSMFDWCRFDIKSNVDKIIKGIPLSLTEMLDEDNASHSVRM